MKKKSWFGKEEGGDWLLKGDANTSYFHGIANGRKRKCLIRNLVEEDRTIEDKKELKRYIRIYLGVNLILRLN